MKLALIGLLIASANVFAQASCPSLAGTWTGSCQVNSGSLSAKFKKLQPMLHQAAGPLVITQSSSPLTCQLATVESNVIAIGGSHSESISLTDNNGDLISISSTSGGRWDLANQALIVSTSGMAQFGANVYASFTAVDTLTLEPDGSLQRVIDVAVDNQPVEIRCSYQANP